MTDPEYEKRVALAAIDAKAQVLVCEFRGGATGPGVIMVGIQVETLVQTADTLETLLAENKALRATVKYEKDYPYNPDEEHVLLSVSDLQDWNSKLFNPETHVPVPREPTAAMLLSVRGDGLSPLWNETISAFYRAMLTAAEEKG